MEGAHLNPAHLAERPFEVGDFRRMRSHDHVDSQKRHGRTGSS
jgi:hypothetical protein